MIAHTSLLVLTLLGTAVNSISCFNQNQGVHPQQNVHGSRLKDCRVFPERSIRQKLLRAVFPSSPSLSTQPLPFHCGGFACTYVVSTYNMCLFSLQKPSPCPKAVGLPKPSSSAADQNINFRSSSTFQHSHLVKWKWGP